MPNVAVFVSGSGTLLDSFVHYENLPVITAVADRECSAVQVAMDLGLTCPIFEHLGNDLLDYLADLDVKLICLAGFLRIVPPAFIEKFDGKILNTHPSLLPKHGGLNFYGDKVHQAVLDSRDSQSGMTVHEVEAVVDTGRIIKQITCDVMPDDTLESLRTRVQNLENEWYPQIAFEYLKENFGE